MKKKFNSFFLFLIIPAFLIIFSIISLFDKGIVIFPGKNFYIGYYSDNDSKVMNFNADKEKVELEYILKKGSNYPYTGIFINILEPDNKYLNLFTAVLLA